MSSFSGSGHSFEGCHDDTITFSSIGTVYLTSSVEGAVTSGSEFILLATIRNFTEASSESVTLGFSSQRSDNNMFTFNSSFKGSISLNTTGHSLIQSFTITAPTIEGTYTITADALNDPDGASDEVLDWASGSIEITVQTSSNEGSPDDDLLRRILLIGGTLVGISVLSVQIFLTTKFLIKGRNFKERESSNV